MSAIERVRKSRQLDELANALVPLAESMAKLAENVDRTTKELQKESQLLMSKQNDLASSMKGFRFKMDELLNYHLKKSTYLEATVIGLSLLNVAVIFFVLIR